MYEDSYVIERKLILNEYDALRQYHSCGNQYLKRKGKGIKKKYYQDQKIFRRGSIKKYYWDQKKIFRGHQSFLGLGVRVGRGFRARVRAGLGVRVGGGRGGGRGGGVGVGVGTRIVVRIGVGVGVVLAAEIVAAY